MRKQELLTPEDFTGYEEIPNIIRDLKQYFRDKKIKVSDVRVRPDDSGLERQYIDLVMEGGGVLGVALVGYTYCLEQAGIRFLSIGGTSAGAINALLLAALGKPEEEKSARLVELLANTSLYDFVDGGGSVKDLLEAVFGGANKYLIGWRLIWVIRKLLERLGLNPGQTFFQWLTEVLAENDVATVGKLQKQLRLPDNIAREYDKENIKTVNDRLALIATEVSTLSKIRFPEMSELFWSDPAGVNPAHFVRASMSVPGFFSPHRVGKLPQDNADRWWQQVRYRGKEPPTEAVFLDGGLLSNFPIYVFHVSRVPKAPTFGVRLGADRLRPIKISNIGNLSGAALKTMRNVLDYDFLKKNPDYSYLISIIDTGDHHWLNFNLSADDKKDLFRRGVLAASAFLRRFDWEDYKSMRKELVRAQQKHQGLKQRRLAAEPQA